MSYIAKEKIYLNEAGQPCEPDDPQVAQQLCVPGSTLKDTVVARYGLEKDHRLMPLPKSQGETRERGTDYYELTGNEKPVTKAERATLGQEKPAKQPAPATPACSISSVRSNGCATTSHSLAATRAT